ncbi:MAG TPA: hypothetical protein VGS06_23155, partial [Streptosporangiaceae bacterium]|nr:hypothetical protein [Streptosporangiaceae bacterium]
MEGHSAVSAGRELAGNEAAGAVTRSPDVKSLDNPVGRQPDYQSTAYASDPEDRREIAPEFALGGRQSSQAAGASSAAESARIPPAHRSSGLRTTN